MTRGAWWAIVHGVTKELDMTLKLNNNRGDLIPLFREAFFCKRPHNE